MKGEWCMNQSKRGNKEICIFNNPEFGEVRTVVIDSEILFFGVDVATALSYARPSKAVTDNCKGVLTEDTIKNGGGYPEKLIKEGDVYRLIVKASEQSNSEKVREKAEEFENWIFDEVLPTIRKTGGYVNNDELFIDTYLPYADESTKLIFAQTLKIVREQNETIKKQKAEIMHKEDVIIGLVEDIDLATKRQRITQIVRFGANGNYQDRYGLLYCEFERKYHCNLKMRMESCALKPKVKNKMDYIDRAMNMIPQLYELACKLFENDVEKLKAEWENIVA